MFQIHLNQQSANEDNIEILVNQYKEERKKKKNPQDGLPEGLKESLSLYDKKTESTVPNETTGFSDSDNDYLSIDLDQISNKKSTSSKKADIDVISDSDSDSHSSALNQKKTTARGRGRGQRAARGGRGSRGGRGARAKAPVVTSDIGSYFSPVSKKNASSASNRYVNEIGCQTLFIQVQGSI